MFKRKQILSSVIGAIVFTSVASFPLTGAAADTSGGPPQEYSALLKMKAEDIMHMMDKTGRGKVSRAEFMKFHEDMFKMMDKNKDGFLTNEEFYTGTQTN